MRVISVKRFIHAASKNIHVVRAFLMAACIICLIFFVVNTAIALNLGEAKSRGLVGEKPNGYLGAVQAKSSPDVKELIANINSKRKSTYKSIAKKNGTSLKNVEALAGSKALTKTTPGKFVQLPSGQWQKK